MTRRATWLLPLLALLAPAAVRAQDGARQAVGNASARVHVIGASLSAGMALHDQGVQGRPGHRYDSIGLAAALDRLYPSEAGGVADHSDLYLFLDAVERGPRQIDAVGEDTALVFALDFLFWYGYGKPPAELDIAESEREPDEVEAWRLEKQDDGFAELERLLQRCEARVVIGDYPDMHGANPLMLPAPLIPTAATIAALSARARTWAAERDRVLLFPLAATVARVRDEPRTHRHGEHEVELGVRDLLQMDRLHPTRLGVAVLLTDLTAWLRERLPADDARRPRDLALADAFELCGATPVLDTLAAGK